MKKKELLQLIQALEKQVSDLQGKIALLETKVALQEPSIITIPSLWPSRNDLVFPNLGCIDGKGHEYPFPWYGTMPASCKKCGQAPSPYTVTCSTK